MRYTVHQHNTKKVTSFVVVWTVPVAMKLKDVCFLEEKL